MQTVIASIAPKRYYDKPFVYPLPDGEPLDGQSMPTSSRKSRDNQQGDELHNEYEESSEVATKYERRSEVEESSEAAYSEGDEDSEEYSCLRTSLQMFRL
jgi:hypothetical protein